MATVPAHTPAPGAQQIAHGFLRIAQVLRQDGYRGRERHGLSVTQAQLVALVASRGPLRVGEIARELGVTSASASDSLRALDEKGLIGRSSAPGDRRATLISLSPEGHLVAPLVAESVTRLVDAVSVLPGETRDVLLGALVELIAELAAEGVIAPARLCATCAWFEPGAHPGEARPNHCRFVDEPLGPADLRIECSDHTPSAAGGPASPPARPAAS